MDVKLHLFSTETMRYVTSFSGLEKKQPPTFQYSLVRILTDEDVEDDSLV